MKSFKQILMESKGTIYTSYAYSGTALCRRFDKKEQNEIVKAIKKNPNFKKLESWLNEALDKNLDYSDTIVVEYNGKKITIYGANGALRIGGNAIVGGAEGFMNCTEIADIDIKDLAKVISSAKVK